MVIIPEKFHNYRSRLFFLFFRSMMCMLNCYLPLIISRSLFVIFNTSLSVSSLLFSSMPLMITQFRREYCPCWSMLSSRSFVLLVTAETSSFIYYFSYVLFHICQTLLAINLTDFVRPANGCSPLISGCQFWFTKFRINQTSFCMLYKQFISIPGQSGLSKALWKTSHWSIMFEVEVVCLRFFLALQVFESSEFSSSESFCVSVLF